MMRNANLLPLIDNKKKIDILRKNWMSHDARCQMAIVQEFGWEKGNKLNKIIIRDIGIVMMYRLMNALKIKEVKNIDDMYNLCTTAVNFYYPPPLMQYKFQKVSDTEILGVIKKCPTIENVKKIGVEDFYECGCFSMRSGWYQALKVNVKETCLSCIKDGDIECKIKVNVENWD